MKTILRLIPFVAMMAYLPLANATSKKPKKDSVIVKSGFFTATDYMQMSEEDRRGYATGFLDGLLCAPFLDAPPKKYEWLSQFVTGKNNLQVAAILTKYLTDRPEKWDLPLNFLAYEAFEAAAQKREGDGPALE